LLTACVKKTQSRLVDVPYTSLFTIPLNDVAPSI
jgi:hypothetical protein